MGKWLRSLSWKLSFTVIFTALAFGVTACGGGGGGSAASSQPSITSFTAGAAIITEGSSVSLTAVFANGTGVIDNGVGSVTSGSPVSVTPSTTTTYTLTVANTAGDVVTSMVTVTVVPPPSITSFTTDAAIITAGSSVSLTAVFANGTGVIDNGVGSVSSGSPVTLAPSTTTTYTLTVTNAAGTSVTASVTVTVVKLDSLSVTTTELDQLFQSAQSDYTATVGFLVKSVKVTATTLTVGATITVDGVTLGADNTSQLIGLSEGGNPPINIIVTASSVSKTYTLTLTRQTVGEFAQQAYVKASNTDAGDSFGNSVALSGDTLAVCAPSEDSNVTGINGNQADNSASYSGAVYIFTRNGTTWTQQAYIKASNTDVDDVFGSSVALSGDTLAVGALGEASNATRVNGNQADDSAPLAGAVYVFTRSGATWTQQAYIKASNTDASDYFGRSVALSGDTLAVGADGEDSNLISSPGSNATSESGAVYVFTRNGNAWSQQAYIKASNTGTSDGFGNNVALSGDTLAVGAGGEDSNATGVGGDQTNNSATSAGAVYVFTRSGTTWTQQAYIKASNTETLDMFGISVALSGDTLAVGAVGEDSNATGVGGDQTNNTATSAGAVYVFTRSGTTWTQQAYIKASNTESYDSFSRRLTLSNDTLAVGANCEASNATGINGNETDNSTYCAGAVYVFTRSGTTWTQQAYIKASNTELNADTRDGFGIIIALSEDTLAVAANGEDSISTGINGDQTNDPTTTTNAGAVYVFE